LTQKIAVVSPEGEEAAARVRRARRLDALAGKTVCEFWNGVFKGDITFPLIRRRLQERHPGLTIVPYTEFPHSAGSDDPARQREHAERLAQLARERGAHAVISGNGA
jgi:hypothetical protein